MPSLKPAQHNNQRKKLLIDVLKGVSRSFYLTLRILPKEIGEQIGVAYLLARAADTLADTTVLAPQRRIECLTLFREQLISGVSNQALGSIQSQMKGRLQNPDEQRLLELIPQLFALFASQSAQDQAMIRKVVLTLTEGMVFDLHAFPSEESGRLKALDTAVQTDKYTYLVAGCVGEFWTDMSIAHVPELKLWNTEKLSQLGTQFGKGLQMTNILRDLPRDLRIGRCYLSAEWLQAHDLTLEMLLNSNNANKVRPLYEQAIRVALEHFKAAEQYVLAIPEQCTRLRLAALWPLLIGLATLQMLAASDDYLDKSVVIKVGRGWIYRMILRSLFASGSNHKLREWIGRETSGVESQLKHGDFFRKQR